MRSLFAVMLAVALLSLAVGAMAAGTAIAPAKAKANMIGGTIKSVGAHSLTIDRGPTHSAADRIVVVSLNKSTAYTLGGKTAKLNDAKAGSKVFIRLTDQLKGTKGTAAAVHVQVAQPAKPKMSTSSMPTKTKSGTTSTPAKPRY